MNTFFRKKVLSPFGIFLLCLVLIAGSCAGTWLIMRAAPTEQLSNEALYKQAVDDAVFADADEIYPLVTIDKNSDMVTWNESGDKVLLLSWNSYPDRYPSGQSFICKSGEIWAFTDKEMIGWYMNNAKNVTDWNMRLKQLIGLPEFNEYTHVTAFWADLDEIIRPAYQTDVTKQITPEVLDSSGLGIYEEWFDLNTLWSYFDSAYPWTRLGYTYDWADNGTEYGLSEFLILPDSEVEVAWTITTAEFISCLAKQANIQK